MVVVGLKFYVLLLQFDIFDLAVENLYFVVAVYCNFLLALDAVIANKFMLSSLF